MIVHRFFGLPDWVGYNEQEMFANVPAEEWELCWAMLEGKYTRFPTRRHQYHRTDLPMIAQTDSSLGQWGGTITITCHTVGNWFNSRWIDTAPFSPIPYKHALSLVG